MSRNLVEQAKKVLESIESEGLLKRERIIVSPQSSVISAYGEGGGGRVKEVLNLCANNYLGLHFLYTAATTFAICRDD